MIAVEIAGGLVYLLLAGDLLVRGSVSLARRTRIPPAVVGLTIVAFGTSAPELFVSLGAALQGHPAMSLGNVVGSNIANVLIVLGLPALIVPTGPTRDPMRTDTVWMLAVSGLFTGLCAWGPIGTGQGLVLLALLGVMLVRSLRRSEVAQDAAHREEELDRLLGLPRSPGMISLFLLLGALGLPLGAYLVVDGAVQLAAALGVSDAVIGLSVVAFGTSLPELATTVAAALRRHADVAIGNVLGSNLFNLLGIMGVVAVVAPEPIPVPEAFLRFDLLVMLGSAVWLSVLALRGGAVSRTTGILLTGAYLVYLAALYAPGTLRGSLVGP